MLCRSILIFTNFTEVTNYLQLELASVGFAVFGKHGEWVYIFFFLSFSFLEGSVLRQNLLQVMSFNG